MLCIIFTKRKLLAGIKTNKARLLDIKGRSHFSYEPSSAYEVLSTHLGAISEAYTSQAKKDGHKIVGSIPTSIAFPVDLVDEGEQNKIIELIDSFGAADLQFIHSDNFVVSFLNGLPGYQKKANKNTLVLESIDDYTHLCFQEVNGNAPKPNLKEQGREGLFKNESFECIPFKDFGSLAGNDRVLTELMAECSVAGLSVDFKGQAQLARQLEDHNPLHRYVVSKNTGTVQLEAEITLKREKYEDLLLVNKDKLANKFSAKELQSRNIDSIVLIGGFLRTQAFKKYLDTTLKLGDKVIAADLKSGKDEFAVIVNGLALRTEQVMEAERIRLAEVERKRLEAEKRAKIAAELKVKEERDVLLQEIAVTCVDPNKQAEYEKMFKVRGAKLGIPEMVINWNITEVLSKIELQKEGEGVGLYTHMGSGNYVVNEEEDSPSEEAFDLTEEDLTESPATTEKEITDNFSDEELYASLDEVLATETKEDLAPQKGNSDLTEIDLLSSPTPDKKKSPQLDTPNNSKSIEPIDIPTKIDVLPTDIKASTNTSASTSTSSEEKVVPAIDKSIMDKSIAQDQFATKPEKLTALEELPKKLGKEPISSNGNHNTLSTPKTEALQVKEKIETPKVIEKESQEVSVEEKKVEETTPFEEPVLEEPKKTMETMPAKVKNLDASISLSDLFSIKGTLPDPEFSTKKVMMVGDQELKAVRVLAAGDIDDKEKLDRFYKLHKKELSYYQEMSEITEAKEGLFYFRPYIERSTLKMYVKKSGLDNKMDIDELSSTDLKFILQVFKEIRELPTGHANLTEDNILVISKRKWNLQKNMEIKVVGFTSEDATSEQMLERTHEVFSSLLGNAFYQDFREKFQL